MKKISLFLYCVLLSIVTMAQNVTFSTEEAPIYYLVRFSSGNYLYAPGDGAKCLTTNVPTTKGALWAFIGTKTNFKMVADNGQWLGYANERFCGTSKSSAQSMKFYTRTDGNFELMTTNVSGKGMNQWGGTDVGKELGLWNNNDGNNSLNIIPIEEVDLTDYSALQEKVASEYASVSTTSSYTFLPEDVNPLKVWFNKPATKTTVENKWMEYSQPIGNGHLGASLFGGIYCDQLQFNEKSLWSGKSQVGGNYGYYRNFGSLYVIEEGDVDLSKANSITKYVRYLDIEDAVAGVNFLRGDKLYTRRYLASEPDDVVAAHYVAPEGQKLAFCVVYQPGEAINNSAPKYEGAYGEFHGKLDLVSYNTQFRVVPIGEGATITSDKDGIHVANADEVLVLLAGKTDYDGTNMTTFSTGVGQEGLYNEIRATLDKAATKGWESLLTDHKKNYRSYFDRVKFNLNTGTSDASSTKNTEALINYFSSSTNNYKSKEGLYLQQLYFHYGRYLMISCSRGSMQVPSNLQGLWNDKANAPWHSDIHTNINIQMNYWPAEPTNLSECHMPLLDHIINLSNSPGWKDAAKRAGQTGWTVFTESNIFGGMSTFASNYVVANAWYCTHLWQHYRYTLDKEYLKRAFPAMWAAAQFWTARLKKNTKDGTWECPNEWSPEHGPNEDAVAHAQQLVLELLQNTSDAYDVLGTEAGITEAQISSLRTKLEGMDNGLHTETYDGQWGADFHGIKTGDILLREWKTSNYTSGEKNHRHQSHLMCLYPFNQVYPGHEYFGPAVNSLQHRGDAATGWSLGWKINLWARAQDGDHAMIIIKNALKHSTSYGTNQGAGGVYYNLYDSHAPFQIDGNFGTCAGIAEMLMQSCTDTISILPALPSIWKKGEIKGLKAVGDFNVSIEWENNLPTHVTITNNQGQPLYVKAALAVGNYSVLVNGAEVTPIQKGDSWQIPSQKGDIVTINFSETAESVNTLTTDKLQQTHTYDLAGRIMKGNVRGIKIANGKKIVK